MRDKLHITQLTENRNEPMKILTKNSLSGRVALTSTAHQLADKFCQLQGTLPQAEQVYLNTLAVCAVNDYLQKLGFATDLAASDSQDAIMQTVLDVADLLVKNCGKLECRVVQPEAEVVCIPEEVWHERIGYVAVQFNESLDEAMLLGFVAKVSSREFPLNQLQSLADLPEYLQQVSSALAARQPGDKPWINLSQWWEGVFEVGWQTIEEVLAPSQAQLAFNVRSAIRTQKSIVDTPTQQVERVKLLSSELKQEGNSVALLVGLIPDKLPTIDISVEVYPTAGKTELPEDMELMILDDSGAAVMQAQARNSQTMRFNFSGEPGDFFRVKVVLGDISFTEAFVV